MTDTDDPDSTTEAEYLFLGSEAGNDAYRDAVARASEAVVEAFASDEDPYSGASPETLVERLAETDLLPEDGQSLDATVDEVAETVLSNSVEVSNPRCIAHLHCPPLVPALAAETAIAATNQSMDSWDQAPAATHVEQELVALLCDLFGYGETGDGVFTSGGTQSNFMGLLLARDWYAREQWDCRVKEQGLPREADSMCILCSEAAHFTADQAAAHLGLGEQAVVTVPTDDEYRMDLAALDETIADLHEAGREPFALFGTAGTTDFGSVDPLDALADRAADHDMWFHVDAAYGGALALSDDYRDVLAGVERADSLAVDFHKLFYQPLSCGAFLLDDADHYELLERSAAYLNPEEGGLDGPDLVGKSVQTSRRFDALKPYVTFRTLGRERLAALVESTLELADEVAALLADAPDFEVLVDPTLNAVVFRYRPEGVESDAYVSHLNAAVREALLDEGDAVVGRTEVDGVTTLKFTLLNPKTTVEDVKEILAAVRRHGEDVAVLDSQPVP